MSFFRLFKGRGLERRGAVCLYVVTLVLFLLPHFAFSSLPGIRAQNLEQARLTETVELVQGETAFAHVNSEEFKPVMQKQSWTDRDNNGVADSLDKEIADRVANGTARNYVNVIVGLRSEPTANDANTFALCGGYATTSPWKYAVYGFGGQIPYYQIEDFVQQNPNVLLVEKEMAVHATIAYAASQVGARSYVWNTLGLKGDPNSSIAIVDTGIDDSHPDFSPGFGDMNFTRKIVGWNDQINPGTTSPYDDEGHGSHVSGLAAGNGFFSNDSSGNAIATWGANLGRLDSGTYLISGMMVNDSGFITINVKWKNPGDGTLDTFHLYHGDKTLDTGSWFQVESVSPSNQDQWYTLTYNVNSAPSSGYDMYHVLMSFTAGKPSIFDNFYVVFNMSWPYNPSSDGFPAWTGIAPEARLVGVKGLDYRGSGTDTGLISAIDWIIANREAYHIVVTSMSLGFSSEVSLVDAAMVNLVNSGITTIVSAGNSGSGGNTIYTPGSVDEVITVAATNQFDNIASYSGQGGTSRYGGNTMKPDIAAPGGSFLAVPLLSADSNDGEAGLGWSEVTLDDGALMQGTSMSTPVVAGAADIVIQAMGGFANWQYTRNQALMPKMIMLMTATETYPNFRESALSGNSPSLERGGKDAHEGYGRLNLDVAIDAILKTYEIGTTLNETLGKPPTLLDISVLGQKLAWARKVQLVQGWEYNFTLTVPTSADYDLYLYNSTGTSYGEPAIVVKSTLSAVGGHEQVVLNAPYTGIFYLVVKRATATTGSGTFMLQSSYKPEHDVAVVGVEPFAAAVYEGNSLNITVTVRNEGLSVESFNVSVSYDDIVISEQQVNDLPVGAIMNLTFIWNTTSVVPNVNYTITAEADLVLGESEIIDNTFVDSEIFIKIMGDVNGDGTVDIFDIGSISAHWYPGPPVGPLGYDWYADVNDDGAVDIFDVGVVSANWGRTE